MTTVDKLKPIQMSHCCKCNLSNLKIADNSGIVIMIICKNNPAAKAPHKYGLLNNDLFKIDW